MSHLLCCCNAPAAGYKTLLTGTCRLLGQEGAAQNLALPESVASGTASGVALAVAADAATIGIGIDHLAGVRVRIDPLTDIFLRQASLVHHACWYCRFGRHCLF